MGAARRKAWETARTRAVSWAVMVGSVGGGARGLVLAAPFIHPGSSKGRRQREPAPARWPTPDRKPLHRAGPVASAAVAGQGHDARGATPERRPRASPAGRREGGASTWRGLGYDLDGHSPARPEAKARSAVAGRVPAKPPALRAELRR